MCAEAYAAFQAHEATWRALAMLASVLPALGAARLRIASILRYE